MSFKIAFTQSKYYKSIYLYKPSSSILNIFSYYFFDIANQSKNLFVVTLNKAKNIFQK
jgi:hypothetical protein